MPKIKPFSVLLFCLIILSALASGAEAKPMVEVRSRHIYHRLHDEAFIVSASGVDEDGNRCSRMEKFPVDRYFPNADLFPGPFKQSYGTHLICRRGDKYYVIGYTLIGVNHCGDHSEVNLSSTIMTDWGFNTTAQQFYVDIDPETIPLIPAEYVGHLTEEMVINYHQSWCQKSAGYSWDSGRIIEEPAARQPVEPIVEVMYRLFDHSISGEVCLVLTGYAASGNVVCKRRRLRPEQFFATAGLHEDGIWSYPYGTHLVYQHGDSHYLIGHTVIELPYGEDAGEPILHSAFLTDWGLDPGTQEIYIDMDIDKLPEVPAGCTVEPLRPGMITEKLLYERLHGLPGVVNLDVYADAIIPQSVW